MLACHHCGTENAVAACRGCGRRFVVTDAHVAGRPRPFECRPVSGRPDGEFDQCDFCAAKAAGLDSVQVVQAGLRQPSCPNCHTEFLWDHGL